MKKIGVLHHRLSEVIASMGHGDILVIGDAGLPIPPGVERIDLAFAPGMPAMLDVTRAVATELQVERLMVASELEDRNQAFALAIGELFPHTSVSMVSHEQLKAHSARARSIVRTGECTPYANVVLISGVTF